MILVGVFKLSISKELGYDIPWLVFFLFPDAMGLSISAVVLNLLAGFPVPVSVPVSMFCWRPRVIR